MKTHRLLGQRQSKKKTEMDFRDGVYVGFFGGKSNQIEVLLTWERKGGKFFFSGDGVDAGGEHFHLEGETDSAPPYRVKVARSWKGGQQQGEGFRAKSEATLFGSLLVGAGGPGGEWSLRWSDVQRGRLAEQAHAQLYAELCDMGFPEDAVSNVLARPISRLDAIDALSAASREEPSESSPTDDPVDSLVAMGFDRARALEALKITSGNMELAVEYLMNSS